MKTLYVDTNIYLDFLLNRKNKLGVPLGPKAWNMFSKILFGDYVIMVSTKVLEEIEGEIKDFGKAKMLFEFLKLKIKKIPYTQDELDQAEKMDKEHRNDALHALLANKHGADYLVTRNTNDFKKFSVKLKLPEDV